MATLLGDPWAGQCTTGAGMCRATERTTNGATPKADVVDGAYAITNMSAG
jgi:hypothetical protein